MTLFIQASHPRTLRPDKLEARDLSSAISRVFPTEAEDAVLSWHAVPVLLSYHYQLSVIMPELLDMLEACTGTAEGTHLASFPASSFRVRWELTWRDGHLDIAPRWTVVRGNYQSVLAKQPALSLPVEEFAAEWKAVLECVVCAVDDAGVYLVAGDDRLDRLRRLTAGIPRYGKIYPAGR